MNFFYIGIFILGTVISCTEKKRQFVKIKNSSLNAIVYDYIGEVEKRSKLIKDSVIDINLKQLNDTTVVVLVDTYPDLRYEKYNAHTVIKNYTIIFTGETPKGYLEVTGFDKLPDKLAKSQENMFNENNPPTFYEPMKWTFYFVKDSVISYDPPSARGLRQE